MAHPSVSIAIPTWNRREMLQAALLSAQAQTHESLEIVVCDNASTDDTVEMVREMAREDDRIRLYVNETNIGTANYQRVLQWCRGTYVKFLNSDDLLVSTAVERLIEPMCNPEVGLSVTRQVSVDENLGALPEELSPNILGPSGLVDGYVVGNASLAANQNLFGCHSAHLFRRAELEPSTLGVMGGRRLLVAADVVYCLQLVAGRRLAYDASGLVLIRRHPGQDTFNPDLVGVDELDWLHLARYAPQLGYLTDPAVRHTAVATATARLARLAAISGGRIPMQVLAGLGNAVADLIPLQREAAVESATVDGRVELEPDWDSPAAVRAVLSTWFAEAIGVPGAELVLLADPRRHDLATLGVMLLGLIVGLGYDPATCPDVTLEPLEHDSVAVTS